MNRKVKKAIVSRAKRLRSKRYGNIPVEGSCLYFAWAVCVAAQERGIRAILQAGTAYWPRINLARDDGLVDTHFGYEWGEELAQLILTRQGPFLGREMHVWAVIPETKEIIDLTTAYWPAQCRKLLGAEWTAPKPPAYLWARYDELPKGVVYEAKRDACELAVKLLVG